MNTESIKQSIRLRKGIFGIFLIATIITLFELLFYIYIISPLVKVELNNLINVIAKNRLDPKLGVFINILIKREKNTINDLNNGSYAIIIVEILLMCSLLVYIYIGIKKCYKLIEEQINMTPTIITSIIGVLILIVYQVSFFFLSKEFLYIGSRGLEEMISIIILNLENRL